MFWLSTSEEKVLGKKRVFRIMGSKKTVTMSIDKENYLNFRFYCWSTGRKVSPFVEILMQKHQKGSMNVQVKRNETRQLLNLSFNSKENCINFGKNESFMHFLAKCLLCWEAHLEEKDFVTEAHFENGKKADVLILDDNEAWEVLYSETIAEFKSKQESYPVDQVLPLQAMKVIRRDLELFMPGWRLVRK